MQKWLKFRCSAFKLVFSKVFVSPDSLSLLRCYGAIIVMIIVRTSCFIKPSWLPVPLLTFVDWFHLCLPLSKQHLPHSFLARLSALSYRNDSPAWIFAFWASAGFWTTPCFPTCLCLNSWPWGLILIIWFLESVCLWDLCYLSLCSGPLLVFGLRIFSETAVWLCFWRGLFLGCWTFDVQSLEWLICIIYYALCCSVQLRSLSL